MPLALLMINWTCFLSLAGSKLSYAQPITGQVTEVTCPVIGRAQPELTPSKGHRKQAESEITGVHRVFCPTVP